MTPPKSAGAKDQEEDEPSVRSLLQEPQPRTFVSPPFLFSLGQQPSLPKQTQSVFERALQQEVTTTQIAYSHVSGTGVIQ